MTPEQRRLRAKIAANARWSHPTARAEQAEAARAAVFGRLEREVDPLGKLSPDQRAKLVRAAARRLSAELNAARARKRRTTATLLRHRQPDLVRAAPQVQTLLQTRDTASGGEETLPVRITDVTERVAIRIPIQ